jgi:hypothetical protein
VKDKFSANHDEATDLPEMLVFESHLRRNTTENGIGPGG